MGKTKIINIDEETLTAKEPEDPAKEPALRRIERFLHEVESYGQTAE
jgi:hypothetical protein